MARIMCNWYGYFQNIYNVAYLVAIFATQKLKECKKMHMTNVGMTNIIK